MMLLSSMLLLFIAGSTAAPISRIAPMPDCSVCMGITVQIRRSPASLVICDVPSSSCMNITDDVRATLKDDMFYKMTPEDLCAAMGYCPQNIAFTEYGRIIDMLTDFDPIPIL